MMQGPITVTGCRCERCRWEWVPKFDKAPRVCPHCKSPYWNIPRKKKTAGKKPATPPAGSAGRKETT